MDVGVAIAQGQFVAVVVLEGFDQAWLCGDDVIELKMIEQNLTT